MPLGIYPEGATTNGTSLLQFKRGAFMSLRKVKPHVSQFWTLTGARPTHGDATSLLSYIAVLFYCVVTCFTVQELPVFEPNEFFWKNHWQKDKEQKWECYARVMRKIMADHGGFQLSDCTQADKLHYKKMIRRGAQSLKAQ